MTNDHCSLVTKVVRSNLSMTVERVFRSFSYCSPADGFLLLSTSIQLIESNRAPESTAGIRPSRALEQKDDRHAQTRDFRCHDGVQLRRCSGGAQRPAPQ